MDLHSVSTTPFDMYDIIKDGRAYFIASGVILILYFLLICGVLGLLLSLFDCHDHPPTSAQFLPLAFPQLSGAVDQSTDDSAACLWVSSFALIIRVYFSLPMFSAIVLVRLLAPKGAVPNISKVFILTVRNGTPTLQFKVNNKTGRV